MADHVCPWWMAYTFDNALRRLCHDPNRMLGPYVKAGQKAVDIGCGLGHFTLGLARLVGPDGRVTAIDLQSKMLDGLKRRAKRAGLLDRIETRQCRSDSLAAADLNGRMDFVLTFWMVHEVPDIPGLMRQIHDLLKPDGLYLIAEPGFHTKAEDFEQSVSAAESAGLKGIGRPQVRFSRTGLFTRS
ncbi:MAG: class I SAM-dependent methyltransferase [Thermodesulfobacteriota bacterium]